MSEKVEANFEALSDELLRLALHARLESDRIKALTMLFDRALGKTPDVVVVEDATEKTAEDLLAAWRETKQ